MPNLSRFVTKDGRFSIVYSGIMRYDIWYQNEKIIHSEPTYNIALQWLVEHKYITEEEYDNSRQKGFTN